MAHLISHDQQSVSDAAFFHWLFISYDQQEVSTLATPLLQKLTMHCRRWVNHISDFSTSYYMINRKCVNLLLHHVHHILLSCPTACEEYCPLGSMQAYQWALPQQCTGCQWHSITLLSSSTLMINNDKKSVRLALLPIFWSSFHINRMWVALCFAPTPFPIPMIYVQLMVSSM